MGSLLRTSAAAAAVLSVWLALSPPVWADEAPTSGQNLDIAVALPLTGDGSDSFGRTTLEGIRLAVEEANAEGSGPHITLLPYDDQGSDDRAMEVAGKVAASRALVVIGPSSSTSSLAAGPIYAQAGLASLCPTATSDAITDNATTFRVMFKNSQQGQALATYIRRVLAGSRADVVVVDNKYGRTLQMGFEDMAKRLGIEARYFTFKTADEADQIAQRLADDASARPIVFLTLDPEAARMLVPLRRRGLTGPFLGADALGDDTFSALLAKEPEERRQPGLFTENVYGISPMILDSANADTLAFAARVRARFGHAPVWMTVAGYDAARMAIAAARAAAANAGPNDATPALRAAALSYLTSLNSVENALPGLIGPLWFDPDRGGQAAVRIGRFNRGRFESAPLQIMPVSHPDTAEIGSGAVFELTPGHYGRLQRVVYTGMYINEIPRIDLVRSSFGADVYLWLRYARDAGPDSPDPTDIVLPNLISGSFDRAHPAEQSEMGDGTVYKLWRIQGEFRNDFDLRRFPLDRQTLRLPIFNARAAEDRIVYVLDHRSQTREQGNAPNAAEAQAATPPGSAVAAPVPMAAQLAEARSLSSSSAFRNLTQWHALGASQQRQDLVTESALGDLRRVGAESYRELSGFRLSIGVERRALSALAKTLLPLLLLTFILFASLYFPSALVKEKITVPITGALSAAVLLAAINSQLGAVGYTIAAEYVFYAFFGLCLVCILSALTTERLRTTGRAAPALAVERLMRIVFVLVVAGAVAGMVWIDRSSGA